jgi:hypothetical protein
MRVRRMTVPIHVGGLVRAFERAICNATVTIAADSTRFERSKALVSADLGPPLTLADNAQTGDLQGLNDQHSVSPPSKLLICGRARISLGENRFRFSTMALAPMRKPSGTRLRALASGASPLFITPSRPLLRTTWRPGASRCEEDLKQHLADGLHGIWFAHVASPRRRHARHPALAPLPATGDSRAIVGVAARGNHSTRESPRAGLRLPDVASSAGPGVPAPHRSRAPRRSTILLIRPGPAVPQPHHLRDPRLAREPPHPPIPPRQPHRTRQPHRASRTVPANRTAPAPRPPTAPRQLHRARRPHRARGRTPHRAVPRTAPFPPDDQPRRGAAVPVSGSASSG